MNRNIITSADVAQLSTARTTAEIPKSLNMNPPAGAAQLEDRVAVAAPTPGEDAGGAGPGGVPVPTEDDYLTKLLKYVPLEVLGAYLFIAGVVDSNVTDTRDHAWWLGGLLLGILVITVAYVVRVLGVVRPMQILMSLIGLTAYVFAVGGWFATTTWYERWYATIALPLFGLLVAIVKLKPLPTVGADSSG